MTRAETIDTLGIGERLVAQGSEEQIYNRCEQARQRSQFVAQYRVLDTVSGDYVIERVR